MKALLVIMLMCISTASVAVKPDPDRPVFVFGDAAVWQLCPDGTVHACATPQANTWTYVLTLPRPMSEVAQWCIYQFIDHDGRIWGRNSGGTWSRGGCSEPVAKLYLLWNQLG